MSASIDFVIVAAEEIAFADCETNARCCGSAAPLARIFARDSIGSSETESEGVEKIGKDDRRKRVVEVGKCFIGLAEGAMRQDVRAVGEIEQPRI